MITFFLKDISVFSNLGMEFATLPHNISISFIVIINFVLYSDYISLENLTSFGNFDEMAIRSSVHQTKLFSTKCQVFFYSF